MEGEGGRGTKREAGRGKQEEAEEEEADGRRGKQREEEKGRERQEMALTYSGSHYTSINQPVIFGTNTYFVGRRSFSSCFNKFLISFNSSVDFCDSGVG